MASLVDLASVERAFRIISPRNAGTSAANFSLHESTHECADEVFLTVPSLESPRPRIIPTPTAPTSIEGEGTIAILVSMVFGFSLSAKPAPSSN